VRRRSCADAAARNKLFGWYVAQRLPVTVPRSEEEAVYQAVIIEPDAAVLVGTVRPFFG